MVFFSWLIRRWWFWVLALALLVLALLAASALSLRAAGRMAWEREQAVARAEGIPVSLADLVAAAPAVDAERQERLRRWCDETPRQRWFGYPELAAEALAVAWSGRSPLRRVTPPDPDALRAQHDRETKDVAIRELSTLLDEGPVVWGTPGWLRQRLPRPEDATVPQVVKNHQLARIALLGAIDAYLEQALTGHDPLARRHLDQLLSAVRPMGCTDDLAQYLALSRCRDLAYLLLIADGTLDRAQATAWLDEPAEAAALGVQAMRGDRVIYFTVWAKHPDDRTLLITGGPVVRVLDEVFLPQQLADVSCRTRALAASLQGRVTPGPWPHDGRDWLPAHDVLGMLEPWYFHPQCLIALNRNRMVRAAALALLAVRGDAGHAGVLPADQTEAEALLAPHLNAAAQHVPPLVYERLSLTRFRIGIAGLTKSAAAAGTALGSGVDAVPSPWRQHRGGIGQPAATSAVVDLPDMIEIDCAQRVPYGSVQTTGAHPGVADPE